MINYRFWTTLVSDFYSSQQTKNTSSHEKKIHFFDVVRNYNLRKRVEAQ